VGWNTEKEKIIDPFQYGVNTMVSDNGHKSIHWGDLNVSGWGKTFHSAMIHIDIAPSH